MAAPIGNKYAEGNETSGAPKKSLELLWDTWMEDVISLYSEGGDDVEVKALIAEKSEGRVKASNDLWSRWLIEEEVFSQTIKEGRLISNAWWNRQGRKNLQNKDFSFTGWYMNMKNRFNWTDRNDTTTGGEKLPTSTTVVFKKYDDK
jgi:hypothetical protein